MSLRILGWVALGALLALALPRFWPERSVGRDTAGSGPSARGQVQPDLLELEARLRDLEGRVLEALETLEERSPRAGGVRREIAAEPDSALPEAGAASEASASRGRDERWRAIESGFEHEPVDSSWASSAETTLLAAFDYPGQDFAALEGAVLDEVDCRSRQCRLEVVFDDEAVGRMELQHQLAVAVANVLPQMTGIYTELVDGRTRATFYLATEDHEFGGAE